MRNHSARISPVQRRRRLAVILAAALLASGSAAVAQTSLPSEAPASSKFLPTPDEVTRADHAGVVATAMRKMEKVKTPAETLPLLNAALEQLGEPSPVRGIVQYWRAGVLMFNSNAEAQAAIEESIRLLPDYSAPLIGAAAIYAYANQPGRGADYFLRAISLDPISARKVDDYEVNNLLRRLRFAGEDKRADVVSARLLEIGWLGDRLASPSALALSTIRERTAAGNESGARALATKLLSPEHSYELLVDNRFKSTWDAVERWGGPRLATQWGIYLREARERWTASKNVEAAADYARALADDGHNRTIIRDLAPMFREKLDPSEDQSLQFVVPVIADALGREGQWAEAGRLFANAQAIWPLGDELNQNALNIAANRARSLYHQGEFAPALRYMDETLELARQWDVNPDAMMAMTHYRACILKRLGRVEEAQLAAAIVVRSARADRIANLHLCLDDYAAAKAVLVEALAKEDQRTSALMFMQPTSSRPFRSDHMRQMEAQAERLRADPTLRAEVLKYGRIMPFSLEAGAPPEATP